MAGAQDLPFHCDPYLRWAALTEWRGYARAAQWGRTAPANAMVRIILRAKDPVQIRELPRWVQIPKVYRQDIPGTAHNSVCATASLCRKDLLRLLTEHPEIEWELAAPLKDQDAPLLGSAMGYNGAEADLAPMLWRSVFTGISANARRKGSVKGGAIGVIDFGCPFLHPHFGTENDGKARVTALWDQGHQAPSDPWTKPSITGYGRELGQAAIDAMWQQTRGAGTAFTEARAYAGLNYLVDSGDPRRRVYLATHGSHVLDMAGGVRNPLTRGEDRASKAKLLFVQLPLDTAGDSSGGSLCAHLLDGLRYLLWVTDPEAPLVVNISYGSSAGPHDGSSIIEQAMDELLTAGREKFAIVLAAGNSRAARLHVSRRASLDASVPRNALFRLNVVPGDSTDTFVEFWYSTPKAGHVEFRTRLPSGDWSDWVPADSLVELRDPATSEVVAALVHQVKVPNGARSMTLLALRPTEAPRDDDGSLAEPGYWEVEAKLMGGAAGDGLMVEARIERDDPRPFSGRKQTEFIGLEPDDASNTLCSIATGQHTVVVGGYRHSDGLPVAYSSVGPRFKGQLPLAHAVCEWDSLDAGIRAAAIRGGETFLMNGTSVAAPVLARQLFNDMMSGLATATILQRLQTLSRARGSFVRLDEKPTLPRP